MKAKPEGNPEEYHRQPEESPVLSDSFSYIYILFLICFNISPPKIHWKRSRARVTIRGQCVCLQFSLRINMFDFFYSQNYPMNHIFPGILMNP